MSPRCQIRLAMLILCALLSAAMAVNLLVNPYGAWPVEIINKVYRQTFHTDMVTERTIMTYRLHTDQPSLLLVGSSRVLVGIPVDYDFHDGVFNAGLTGASIGDIGAILEHAAINTQLKRVVWGVDFYAFSKNYPVFGLAGAHSLLAENWRVLMILRIRDTLLNIRALHESGKVLLKAINGRIEPSPATPVPWPEHPIAKALEDSWKNGLHLLDEATIRRQLKNELRLYSEYRLSPDRLSLFRQAVERARERGLEVILFLPPLSECELEAIDQTGQWAAFQDWKQQLLAAGPFWDFSGYNEIGRAPSLFGDPGHFKPVVGHIILRKLLGQACVQCGGIARIIFDGGVWVDTTTADLHLATQEATHLAHARTKSRCAKIVQEALASMAQAGE